jgi:rhodanese-related sulfurtransferase
VRCKAVSIALATLLISNGFSKQALAWGPDGHRMIARLAVESLPPDTPKFMTAALEQLMFLSYEPDAWRDRDEEEISAALRRGHDPDHHFHLELFDPPQLPDDRYAFFDSLRRTGKDPSEVGVLPYRAMELFQRLRVSFRQWRTARAAHDWGTAKFLEARIIDDAGILAHYIGDASEPLHVTVNHNGWEMEQNPMGYTADNTLHGRFEDTYVHAHIHDGDVRPLVHKLQMVSDGLPYIYDEVRRGNSQVIPLYELEKSKPFGAKDDDPNAKAFVAARLADAAAVLRDLWYTAYYTSADGQSKK